MPNLIVKSEALLMKVDPETLRTSQRATFWVKHAGTGDWTRVANDAALPVDYRVPDTRAADFGVTLPNDVTLGTSQVSHDSLAEFLPDLPCWTIATNASFIVVFTVARVPAPAPAVAGAAAPAPAPAGWAAHYTYCKRHPASTPLVNEENAALVRCPAVRPPAAGAPPVNLATGAGLPPPAIVTPRVAKNNGNSWPRMGFLVHHDMRGDMFTYGAMLVLYPRTYVQLLYENGEIARIGTHYKFFTDILELRAPFQVYRREIRLTQTQETAREREHAAELRNNRVRWYYKRVLTNSQHRDREVSTTNYSGITTYLVGEAYGRDPAAARAAVRGAFVYSLPDEVQTAVGTYATTNFATTGLHVVLWSRRGADGPEWNMNWRAYRELEELVTALEETHGTIHQLHAGDRLVADNAGRTPSWTPAAGNLIEFWTHATFPSAGLRAAWGSDRRVQLALWDNLAQRADAKYVHFGNRSGGLEPMALLGMETIYVEPGDQGERGERMVQWQGRIPYQRLIITDYLGDARGMVHTGGRQLTGGEKTSITAALHDALLRARTQLDARTHDAAVAGELTTHQIGETDWDWVETAATTIFDAFFLAAGSSVRGAAGLLATATAVRNEVKAYETANYRATAARRDPARLDGGGYSGTLGYDEYSLSCCFHRPITIHKHDSSTTATGAADDAPGVIRIYRAADNTYYPVIAHVEAEEEEGEGEGEGDGEGDGGGEGEGGGGGEGAPAEPEARGDAPAAEAAPPAAEDGGEEDGGEDGGEGEGDAPAEAPAEPEAAPEQPAALSRSQRRRRRRRGGRGGGGGGQGGGEG